MAKKVELTDAQRAEIIKWAEALESNKYAQGNGMLRRFAFRDDGSPVCEYCCLGVYPEINGGKWLNKGWKGGESFVEIEGERISEPREEYLLKDWFLERTGIDKEGQEYLAQMNDAGYSFARIAKELRGFVETGKWRHEVEEED